MDCSVESRCGRGNLVLEQQANQRTYLSGQASRLQDIVAAVSFLAKEAAFFHDWQPIRLQGLGGLFERLFDIAIQWTIHGQAAAAIAFGVPR